MAETIFVGVTEAAKRLGVCSDTLRAWVKKGQLHALVLPGGRYRIAEVELARFLRKATGGVQGGHSDGEAH